MSLIQATVKTSINHLALLSLLVAGLFFAGVLIGKHGGSAWATVKNATVESYKTRYRVMSDSGLESIVYYVSTKDSAKLFAMAEQSGDILEVAATRISDLYDVRINYATRVQTVKSLRSMSNIDAVITVPLICH